MYCQNCGIEAPTKYVAFYKNIGLLFMRMMYTAEGNFCKPCIHSTFWSFLAVNLLLGWWGIISLVINPFLILNNVFPLPVLFGNGIAGAWGDFAGVDRRRDQPIQPHTDRLIDQLNAGDSIEKVTEDISDGIWHHSGTSGVVRAGVDRGFAGRVVGTKPKSRISKSETSSNVQISNDQNCWHLPLNGNVCLACQRRRARQATAALGRQHPHHCWR